MLFRIIKIWLDVYVILLCSDPSVDGVHLPLPFWICLRMEGKCDAFRVEREERQEKRPNAVVNSLLLELVQILNDVLRCYRICTQTVGTG